MTCFPIFALYACVHLQYFWHFLLLSSLFCNSSATESSSFKTSSGLDLLKSLCNSILAGTATKILASSGQALTVSKFFLINFHRQRIFKKLNNTYLYLTEEHIQEVFYIRSALFIHLYISDLCFHIFSPSYAAQNFCFNR